MTLQTRHRILTRRYRVTVLTSLPMCRPMMPSADYPLPKEELVGSLILSQIAAGHINGLVHSE